ncbi:MAG: phosphocholine cytidylyltransferase family protein [Myxococcales bacterium]|nr:phosphocholine cytidylyltransferase family protein [Myxococcales bacterium]
MKAIIIGAGRGRRLEHLTEEAPKTLVPILGRPMLDSILEALAAGGLVPPEVVFIAGYRGEVVRGRYPSLDFVENAEWERNNILLSLLCAREHLALGFVSSYADIVYRPSTVRALVGSPHDITLVCDTAWRRRYTERSQHPEHDAEKLRMGPDGRVTEISRRIPSEEASGEFIGVMRLTAAGAARFVRAFDEVLGRLGTQAEFREGRSLEKAYLIDLLQHMVAAGEVVHALPVEGGYMEIDTTEDARLAEAWWADIG